MSKENELWERTNHFASLLYFVVKPVRPDISILYLRNCIPEKVDLSTLTLRDVADLIKSTECDPNCVFGEWDSMRSLGRPFITWIDEGDGSKSMMVIEELREESVSVFSLSGAALEIPRREFERSWTQLCIIVDRGAKRGIAKSADFQLKSYLASIVEMSDFLTQDICAELLQLGQSNIELGRSTVGEDYIESEKRTSSTNYNLRYDFTRIFDRLASIIGMTCGGFEPPQFTYYEPGQQFSCHFDSAGMIRRSHTAIIYLNEDLQGGETHFPWLGKKIKPQTGKLLLFPNLDKVGRQIILSLHEGLPLLAGAKSIMTIWSKEAV